VPSRTLVAVVLLGTFFAGIGTGALGGDVLAWRIKAYAKKVLGKLPELEWSELVEMTVPTDAYGLSKYFKESRSLNASIENPHVGEADIAEGGRLFATQCFMCHGADGSGGSNGPSLRRPSYNHGDSSFAIYRVLRDGVPQTAMAGSTLNAVQRWQMVAYLRVLQQGRAAAFESRELGDVNVAVEDIVTAGERSDEWLTYSGNLKGWRYSPLTELTPDNVSALRPVWQRQFPSNAPIQSSTPLAVDGRLFVSESPSNVAAVDARSGTLLWRYEHPLPDKLPVCCGAINRGVAVLGSLVYVATLDAQLVALDANSGAVRWKTTVASPADGYTMTVAPLAFAGLVAVGVSGGEYGIRGFIAAYDAASGKERWRFNTIPAPGEPGSETWLSDAWRIGGGPTWVTGSYDPKLDLLYWGVGNPSPEFQGDIRPGDNLYTNSVVALRGATGELAWHFQFTPHDEHDWDSNHTPILTELQIDGVTRPVICVANRNGYYYVLDREDGKFLRGIPFVRQNWNDGLDAAGRPILANTGNLSSAGRRTYPGISGGTNWYPPAYDPVRQLVFVHTNDQGSVFTQARIEDLEHRTGSFYLGSGATGTEEPNFSVRALNATTGELAWMVEEAPPTAANGITGLLATAGGLVFGATGGRVFALDSSSGRELWNQFLGGNTQAPPITFSLDGRQVFVVWGGRTLTLYSR